MQTSINWHSLRLELIRIYGGAVRAGGRRRRVEDSPPNYRAWFIKRGSGEYRTKERRRKFSTGQWIIPPQTIVWQDFSMDAEILSVHFKAAWPDGTFLFDVGDGLICDAKRHPDLAQSAQALWQLIQKRMGGVELLSNQLAVSLETHLALDTAFRAWITAFCESLQFEKIPPTIPQPLEPRIRLGLEWLNQFPLNAKFRGSDLAIHLGLSVVHMNRLFSREIRRSPSAILEQRRWEKATQLLQYSCLSAKEISHELGFSYPSYFTACFRTRSGKSPKEFRNEYLHH